MADSGLLRFLGNGLRLAFNSAASTYVGLKIASSPASSFYINVPTTLPGSIQSITMDSAGNIGYQALGGGGSVTSVALSLPSIFSVTGSPITTTGTLTATLSSQAANTIFAAPNGSAGSPIFRALVAADIPQTLTAAYLTDFNMAVRTNRLDQLAAPTASVAFNSQKAIGLLDGSNNQDAATWGQVQALFNGTDNKISVRAATTADITLSGTQAVDGVSVIVGDRILVKNQATASTNGIYLVAAGAWTRVTDADISAEVTSGLFSFVEEGTTNGSNGYTLTTSNPITLGTTNLTFAQTSGAGQITAGAGLTKTGNTLDVVGTTNRISVAADSIDISGSYVGQATITTLGTISTGTWQGTAIAVASGGTGAASASAARANLAAAGIYRATFTNASLTGGVLTATHNLGQKIVSVQISDNNDKLILPDDTTLISTTACSVDLTSFGTLTGTWNVLAVG